MRTTRSDSDSQNHELGIRSRSGASLAIRLARGCKCWHPWLQEQDMGQEVPSLKLIANCVPLSRIK